MAVDTVSVTSFKELMNVLRAEVGKAQSDAALDQLAMDAREIIILRTKEGKDCEGQDFHPYSEEPTYISKAHRPAPTGGIPTPRSKGAIKGAATKSGGFAFSAKTGKMVKTAGRSMFFPGGYKQYHSAFSTEYPNLTGTGKMLESLVFRRTDKGRVLYFATDFSNLKASGHIEGNKYTPKRDFFTKLSDAEQAKLSKNWEAYGAK